MDRNFFIKISSQFSVFQVLTRQEIRIVRTINHRHVVDNQIQRIVRYTLQFIKNIGHDSFIICNGFDLDKRNLMFENGCRIVVRKIWIEHPCCIFMDGMKDSFIAKTSIQEIRCHLSLVVINDILNIGKVLNTLPKFMEST